MSLRISDKTLEAMLTAYDNYRLKVSAQWDDSLAPGANARYEDIWERLVGKSEYFGTFGTHGPLSGIASCQGGDEADMIFMHPAHGVDRKLSAEEYRVRSAPYVAAFGIELHPGDLEAGLVDPRVVEKLTKVKETQQ